MSINGTHEERTFIYYPDEQEKNLKNDFQGPLTKLEWPTDYLIIALIGEELFLNHFIVQSHIGTFMIGFFLTFRMYQRATESLYLP